MAEKIIALVSEPISGEALRNALGEEVGETEVLVIAPAMTSRFHWLFDSPDGAIERADAVQEESVERLDEEGFDAAGDTGDSDPLAAIRDTLETFPADRVVLFTHAEGKRNWHEEGLVEQARDRLHVPVTHMVID